MTSEVIDAERNEFRKVQIGNQLWTASNFNATQFQNGDDILEAKSETQWREAERNMKAVWCRKDFSNSVKNKNEKLYNWYAATDKRGLAPNGWRLPTQDDFIELFKFLGAPPLEYKEVFVFYDIGKKLKSRHGWYDFNENGIILSGNGSNESGFNGTPNGEYMDDPEFDGGLTMNFHGSGFLGCWWSSTEDKEFHNEALQFILRNYADYVSLTSTKKSHGASIRFIKDIMGE